MQLGAVISCCEVRFVTGCEMEEQNRQECSLGLNSGISKSAKAKVSCACFWEIGIDGINI